MSYIISVQKRVNMYLNVHPQCKIRGLVKVFKDVPKESLRTYLSRWKNDIAPLLFLYELMGKKYELVSKLTVREQAWMRRIEKIIEK